MGSFDVAYLFWVMPYLLLGIVVVGITHGTRQNKTPVSDLALGFAVLIWPVILVCLVVSWVGWMARKFGD